MVPFFYSIHQDRSRSSYWNYIYPSGSFKIETIFSTYRFKKTVGENTNMGTLDLWTELNIANHFIENELPPKVCLPLPTILLTDRIPEMSQIQRKSARNNFNNRKKTWRTRWSKVHSPPFLQAHSAVAPTQIKGCSSTQAICCSFTPLGETGAKPNNFSSCDHNFSLQLFIFNFFHTKRLVVFSLYPWNFSWWCNNN